MAKKTEKDQRWRVFVDFATKNEALDFIEEIAPSGAEAYYADALDTRKPCHKLVISCDARPRKVERDDDGKTFLERWSEKQKLIDAEIEFGHPSI